MNQNDIVFAEAVAYLSSAKCEPLLRFYKSRVENDPEYLRRDFRVEVEISHILTMAGIFLKLRYTKRTCTRALEQALAKRYPESARQAL